MGLERRKARLGSELKANASGAINFTLSRTYLPLSFLLSSPLSGSFFHSLLLSFFPTCHSCNLIVSINFVVAATRRQTVVHFAAGVASVNSSPTPPRYVPTAPSSMQHKFFITATVDTLPQADTDTRATPCVVLFNFCHIALCASRRITRAFSIL